MPTGIKRSKGKHTPLTIFHSVFDIYNKNLEDLDRARINSDRELHAYLESLKARVALEENKLNKSSLS